MILIPAKRDDKPLIVIHPRTGKHIKEIDTDIISGDVHKYVMRLKRVGDLIVKPTTKKIKKTTEK